jgi:hypothetical protein
MSNAAHGSDGARPKSVYEPVAKLEAFYTGGAVRVTRNNQHMACACGDEVKVMDLATGTVTRTLPGVRRKTVYALGSSQPQHLPQCLCGCLSACLPPDAQHECYISSPHNSSNSSRCAVVAV